MKTYLGMFRGEMKRMFSLWYLSVSILLVFLIAVLGIMTGLQNSGYRDAAFYSLFEQISVGGFFLELIFIPVSYYVVTNLSMDLLQKSSFLYIVRADTGAYIFSKIAVGILFSVFVSEIALNLLMIIGVNVMPPVDTDWFTGGADVYEDLLRRNYLLYFELRILYISMAAGFFTAAGMLLTAVFPNKYVAATSSFLAAVISDKFQLIMNMPPAANISHITGGFIRIRPSLLYSAAYVVLFLAAGMIIMSVIFIKIMKWRIYGERHKNYFFSYKK